MKVIVNYILPIALATILPILNFYSNNVYKDQQDLLKKWFWGSLTLYLIWYFLLYVTKFFKRNTILYLSIAILVSCLLIYFAVQMAFFKDKSAIRWVFIAKFFSASFLFLLIQYALQARDSLLKLQLEKEQMQSENYKVQLQELRAKVEPHFLFNSLNTLRTMIRKNNPQSENFVMNLSNFYRQTLKLNNYSKTKLSEELDILKSYFFLMQTRNEGGIEIEFNINENLLDKELPTLSLQILGENCFKHNRISALDPLKILVFTDDKGHIAIYNKIQPKFTISESTGFGLESIELRYKLLNVEDSVFITQNEDFFEVKLKLI